MLSSAGSVPSSNHFGFVYCFPFSRLITSSLPGPNISLLFTMEAAIDSAYAESSQRIRWTFPTAAALQQRREAVNSRAIELAKQSFALEHELAVAAGDESPTDGQDIEYMSVHEEAEIIDYFARLVNSLASRFQLPSHIRATAAVFFKRFYLTLSVMQRRPKPILLTCLYLATKTNDHYVPLDKFCSTMRIDQSEILGLEFIVCQVVRWDLYVWLPYKPLHGFVLDMEARARVLGELTPRDLESLHGQARAHMTTMLQCSDMVFLYSPSVIALAALSLVHRDLCQRYIEAWFDAAFADGSGDHGRHTLLAHVAEAADVMRGLIHSKGIDSARAAELGRKLAACMDVSRNPDSHVARQRAQQLEQADAQRRAEKARLRAARAAAAIPSNPLA